MEINTLYYVLMLAVLLPFTGKAAEEAALELPFSIGPEYTVTRTGRKSIPNPIPDAEPTRQVTVEVARDHKKAHIFYWVGRPVRDLGPMVKEESWPVEFLRKDAKVIKTTRFMGQKQEVLVLQCNFEKSALLMIYSRDMTKEEFHDMLGSISSKR